MAPDAKDVALHGGRRKTSHSGVDAKGQGHQRILPGRPGAPRGAFPQRLRPATGH